MRPTPSSLEEGNRQNPDLLLTDAQQKVRQLEEVIDQMLSLGKKKDEDITNLESKCNALSTEKSGLVATNEKLTAEVASLREALAKHEPRKQWGDQFCAQSGGYGATYGRQRSSTYQEHPNRQGAQRGGDQDTPYRHQSPPYQENPNIHGAQRGGHIGGAYGPQRPSFQENPNCQGAQRGGYHYTEEYGPRTHPGAPNGPASWGSSGSNDGDTDGSYAWDAGTDYGDRGASYQQDTARPSAKRKLEVLESELASKKQLLKKEISKNRFLELEKSDLRDRLRCKVAQLKSRDEFIAELRPRS